MVWSVSLTPFLTVLFVRPVVVPDALASSLSFTFKELGKCHLTTFRSRLTTIKICYPLYMLRYLIFAKGSRADPSGRAV